MCYIARMAAKRKKKHAQPVTQQGLQLRPRYVLLFFLLTFFVLGGVYLSQQTKLRTIAEQKVTLQAQLDELTVEQERLERMLEYMQTDDYLQQYAREKLGYVFPDDTKFYDDSTTTAPPSPPSPTPLPFGVTDDPTLG